MREVSMRKILKGILIGVFAAMLGVSPTMAAVNSSDFVFTGNAQSQQVTVQIYDRRGNWIADGMLSISNPRNGKIGIYMTTQCHVPVDEIQMDIAVEQYDTSISDWKQVDYLSYNFTPQSGKNLTDATVDTQLPGHEANQTYRLQGWHMVFVNGGSESLESTTGSVLITD